MKILFSKLFFALLIVYFSDCYGNETATNEEQVRILVPAFTSDDYLGRNVSNVLRLQISQTFRESDGKGGHFGRGVLLWDTKPLKELTHEVAFRRATDIGTLTHLVLWGTAIQYGEGVVVQSYLTVSPLEVEREFRPQVLLLSLNTTKGEKTLTFDIPSLHYNFRPVVLQKNIVDKYQTITGIPIYADNNFKKVVGSIGLEFRALKYQNDAVFLRSGGTTGWVELPELWNSHSEIVSFTSAIIRIFRGDWLGARELLQKVIENTNTPQAILIDAQIFNGIIEEKLGNSGVSYFLSAFNLNKFNKVGAQYVIFGLLAEKLRLDKEKINSDDISKKLLEFINEVKYLFPDSDTWLQNVNAILEEQN